MGKEHLNGWPHESQPNEEQKESSIVSTPREESNWFDNMSWKWQVRTFYESLEKEGSLTKSEDDDFYIMKINLPWENPIQLLCLKNTITTDKSKRNGQRSTPYRKDEVDLYHKKAKNLWCEWASKEDIPKLHEKLFELFSKLWNSEKLNKEDPFTFIARFLECGYPCDNFLLKDLVHPENSAGEEYEDEISNCLLSRFWKEFPSLEEDGKAYTTRTWESEHPLYISKVI